MGIVSRLRDAGANFVSRHWNGESMQVSAEIPGSAGPLWRMQFNLDSTPQADGKLVRLRAHWRLSLRREALPGPAAPQPPTAIGARLGRLLERVAQSRLVRPVAEPLLDRELSSWMELRASDAALDEGSQALIPEQLAVLGLQPQADRPVQSWAGELQGGRPGYGVLSLLRMDKKQLPDWLQRLLGGKPFQVAATVATAVEESPTPHSP